VKVEARNGHRPLFLGQGTVQQRHKDSPERENTRRNF
jgi:hypothetical protein